MKKTKSVHRLTSNEKVLLIKEVIDGKPISKTCRNANISRTSFYKWLKQYSKSNPDSAVKALTAKNAKGKQHWRKVTSKQERKVIKLALFHPEYTIRTIASTSGLSIGCVWEILNKRSLATKLDRKRYLEVYGKNIYRPILDSDKVLMIRRYENGDSVNIICRDFRVSRTIFYKWLKKYKNSDSNIEALQNTRPHGKDHWRYISGLDNSLLEFISLNPEYSLSQLHRLILEKKGLSVSRSGLYYILKRLDLNTYEKRLKYVSSQDAVSRQLSSVPDFELPQIPRYSFFSFLSPPYNSIISSFAYFLLISFSSFLSALLLLYIFNISSGHGISYKIGIFFAFISLFLGLLFFLYSLKYYLSIAIVLSFSRQGDGQEDGSPTNASGFSRFFERLFGVSISVESDKSPSPPIIAGVSHGVGDLRAGVGLTADLSGVVLERNPFVSVHVSSYNEKRVIDRLLTACTSFDYPDYEVIVADDSNDETVALLERWKHNPRIKISHRDSRDGYKGGALAQALKLTSAKAEFVLVFDADFIPYPDTITQFLKYFQLSTGSLNAEKSSAFAAQKIPRPADTPFIKGGRGDLARGIAAVQGYQWHVLNKSENWITRGVRSEYAGSYVIERSGAELYQGLKQISGSVYMIRRDVLQSIGWGRSLTEDFELTLKLYEAGYKVVYTPYIQAPAEAVSTIKRLIRQRMRWAEGHSFNIKRMFTRLLFGRWEDKISPDPSLIKRGSVFSSSIKRGTQSIPPLLKGDRGISQEWIPSPLTRSEKLELVYLAPYYLQAAFFIIGTLSWFIAEVIFQVRLPFWTEVWGWSLVATNLLSLPLMNMIGMFMEEAEEKDYLGIFSFVVLSYILAPFQAYAAVKGFIDKEEGPWFRTPKTGKITDTFKKGRLVRFVRGLFGNPSYNLSRSAGQISPPVGGFNENKYSNSYLSLATANNKFQNFRIAKKRIRWAGNVVFVVFISLTTILISLVPSIPLVHKTSSASSPKLIHKAYAQQVSPFPKALPERMSRKEIKNPQISLRKANKDSYVEYIFHKEARVRTKFEKKEIDISLGLLNNQERAMPKKALKELKGSDFHETYYYGDVYEAIDLRFVPKAKTLDEQLILKEYREIDSITYDLQTIGYIPEQKDKEIQFLTKEGKSEFRFGKPFMYEEKNRQNKSFGIEYRLEKAAIGYSLSKKLTPEGKKWLRDKNRAFPVIIDPTQYTSVIQAGYDTTEGQYGSPQRQIQFFENAQSSGCTSAPAGCFYVAYEDDAVSSDGGLIVVEKCALSSNCDATGDWSVVSGDLDTIEATDTDVSPSTFKKNDKFYVAWVDPVGDNYGFTPVHTSNDTLGTSCSGPDDGTINPPEHGIISIGVADDGDVFIAMSETSPSGGTIDWEGVHKATSSCTDTSIVTGSGFDQDDRPEWTFKANSNDAYLWFTADNGLRLSVYVDDGTPGWDTADADVNGATADNTTTDLSAVSDGTDMWVMQRSGTTGDSESFKCSSCPTTGQTFTALNEPFTGLTATSFVGLSYIKDTNRLVAAMMDDPAGANNEQVVMNSTDADSISWGSSPYNIFGFQQVAAGLTGFSMTATVSAETHVAGTVEESTNSELEFSTLPENYLLFFLLVPFFPILKQRLTRRGRDTIKKIQKNINKT